MLNKKQVLDGLETEIRFKSFIENQGFTGVKVGAAYDITHHY